MYFEEAADNVVSDSKRAECMVSVCNKQSVSLREWEDKRRRQTARAADINRLRERKKSLNEGSTPTGKTCGVKWKEAEGGRRWWGGDGGFAWSRGCAPGQPLPSKLAEINRLGSASLCPRGPVWRNDCSRRLLNYNMASKTTEEQREAYVELAKPRSFRREAKAGLRWGHRINTTWRKTGGEGGKIGNEEL